MPERNCDGCKKKDLWGCTAVRWRDPEEGQPDNPTNWVRPAAHPVTVLGETMYCCPRQHLYQNAQMWGWVLKFYGLFKKGFLPSEGGILGQSNKAMELFRILDDANDQCDRAEEEKAKRQGNRKAPGQPNRRSA